MGFRDLFSNVNPPADESTVSVPDALALLAKGGVFIDVRTQHEYEQGHIPGAKLVSISELKSSPLETIWGSDPLALLDPDTAGKAIVVISSTPAHAAACAHLLREADLNAYWLKDGLMGWLRDGQVIIPGPPR